CRGGVSPPQEDNQHAILVSLATNLLPRRAGRPPDSRRDAGATGNLALGLFCAIPRETFLCPLPCRCGNGWAGRKNVRARLRFHIRCAAGPGSHPPCLLSVAEWLSSQIRCGEKRCLPVSTGNL